MGDYQERSFKVTESICHVLITKKEVFMLRSLYIMCWSARKRFQSYGVYISCVDQVERSFKVTECIYSVLITKEEVLKSWSGHITWWSPKKRSNLRSLCIMCWLALYLRSTDYVRRRFNVAESVYYMRVTKEEGWNVGDLYTKCSNVGVSIYQVFWSCDVYMSSSLKLRIECIQQFFWSWGVFISCVL